MLLSGETHTGPQRAWWALPPVVVSTVACAVHRIGSPAFTNRKRDSVYRLTAGYGLARAPVAGHQGISASKDETIPGHTDKSHPVETNIPTDSLG